MLQLPLTINLWSIKIGMKLSISGLRLTSRTSYSSPVDGRENLNESNIELEDRSLEISRSISDIGNSRVCLIVPELDLLSDKGKSDYGHETIYEMKEELIWPFRKFCFHIDGMEII